jgi:hypothetical protein
MSDLKLSHPGRDRLAAFASGQLDSEEAERIERYMVRWLDNSQEIG